MKASHPAGRRDDAVVERAQFLAREASKPGRADAGNAWTVVSTIVRRQAAGQRLSVAGPPPRRRGAAVALSARRGGDERRSGQKCGARRSPRRRWRAGRAAPSTPSSRRRRLAICGDFVAAAACPVEAAALSGEAGVARRCSRGG